MRPFRNNLLRLLSIVCFFIAVSTFGCGRYDSHSRSFVRLDYPPGQFETYYHPGFIFDLTEKERRRGQRSVSSEWFGRARWPVVQNPYDNITSRHVDTYEIYTDDDQQITSDNRPRQRYRHRTRSLRRGAAIR